MKRIVVVQSKFEDPESAVGATSVLQVVQDFDEVVDARKWLKEKATDGVYSILSQIESDIGISTEQVRRSTVSGGHQFITRETAPKPTTPAKPDKPPKGDKK